MQNININILFVMSDGILILVQMLTKYHKFLQQNIIKENILFFWN